MTQRDPEWSIKQFDLGPALELEIINETTGLGEDLTGDTLVAHLVDPATGTTVFTGHAITVVDASVGRFRLVWVAGDTDVAGTLLLEIENTTKKETYPTDGYLQLHVRADLNGS